MTTTNDKPGQTTARFSRSSAERDDCCRDNRAETVEWDIEVAYRIRDGRMCVAHASGIPAATDVEAAAEAKARLRECMHSATILGARVARHDYDYRQHALALVTH